MCLVEGSMSIVLVPHIFRQEVMGGTMAPAEFRDSDTSSIWGQVANTIKAINGSPINFFNPDIKKYPYWKDVQKIRVDMNGGDCIFIPAYNYYQFKAENLSPRQMNKKLAMNPSMTAHVEKMEKERPAPTLSDIHVATIVNFKYEANSDLLKGIYEAIERGTIN